MKKIHYNKLVRDRIPYVIEKSGGAHKITTLPPQRFREELLKKVGEEASALPGQSDPAEISKELADILAVIETIQKEYRITKRQLAQAMKANQSKKGGFRKKTLSALG